jgi:hypothetical protein
MMKTAEITHGLLAAALLFTTASLGAVQPLPALRVVVGDVHYVLDGKVLDDLDELERAVRRAAPAAIALDACGSGSARSLKGAAHRFGHLPLRLQVLAPGDPSCVPPARSVHVARQLDQGPRGIDDAEVERFWRRVMP